MDTASKIKMTQKLTQNLNEEDLKNTIKDDLNNEDDPNNENNLKNEDIKQERKYGM